MNKKTKLFFPAIFFASVVSCYCMVRSVAPRAPMDDMDDMENIEHGVCNSVNSFRAPDFAPAFTSCESKVALTDYSNVPCVGLYSDSIRINNWMLTTDEFPKLLNHLAANVQFITHIDCSYSSITDEQLTAVCKNCPEFRELNLSYCRRLVKFNISSLRNLTKLDVSDTNIIDKQLTAICENNSGIRELNLCSCMNLMQFNLDPLCQLVILNLGNTSITDEQLTTICKNNTCIIELTLCFCRNLFKELESRQSKFDISPLRCLRKLEVECTNINGKQIEIIKQQSPGVDIVCYF